MPAKTTELEMRLWGAADEFRANSKLKSSEYSVPVLGLIFLRYADHKFTQAKAKFTSQGSGRRTIGKADCNGPRSSPAWQSVFLTLVPPYMGGNATPRRE